MNEIYKYWDYFIIIENDLEKLSRFIEFEESNYKTYSVELAHILFAASSEVEVILKGICKTLEPNKKPTKIYEFEEIITDNAQEIINTKTIIPRYNLKFQPFSRWKEKEKLVWWGSYNNVKHKRNIHFSEANLENALNAVSALYVANLYFMYLKKCEENKGFALEMRNVLDKLKPSSNLFRIDDIFSSLEYL